MKDLLEHPPRCIDAIEVEKKYFETGALRYECFWGVITDGCSHLFDDRRDFKLKEDGKYRVRLGWTTKYKRNGDIEWRHKYNDLGKLIEVIK